MQQQQSATPPSTLSKPKTRVQQLIGELDVRARRKLPKPTYRFLVRRYHDISVAAGRNPGRGRLSPDFVVIGAAKAGTTSLYAWLSEHPFVSPASKKEVHYFDYNYFRGDDWYRSHFPLAADQARFAADHGRGFITGEASPSYISHYWVPDRLAQALPDAKLLVALRDPVERAYSQFQMSRRENEEPLEDFAAAVAAEEGRLEPERARLRADRQYNSWPIGCWSYKMRSRYAEQVERWYERFDRSRFHFVTLEQLSEDPQRAMDAIHDFLELPAHTYPDLAARHAAPSYASIPDGVRAELTEYFRPHNERLYELVGTDFGWERRVAG